MIMIKQFVIVWILLVGKGMPYLYAPDPCSAIDGTCKSASMSKECVCRTYTFAFYEVFPSVYLNPITAEVEGPYVEIIKKICETAGKLCEFVMVDFADCWDGSFSNVLNRRWYDACVRLVPSVARKVKYSFSINKLATLGNPLIMARAGSNITEEDLRQPNNYYLGYRSPTGAIVNVFLDGYINSGFYVKTQNIVPILEPKPTSDAFNNIFNALNCGGIQGNQFDIFLTFPDNVPDGNFTVIAEFSIGLLEMHTMFNKDSQCLLKWYDEAYKQFICSNEYPEFCTQLTEFEGNTTQYCCQHTEEICN